MRLTRDFRQSPVIFLGISSADRDGHLLINRPPEITYAECTTVSGPARGETSGEICGFYLNQTGFRYLC